MQPTSNAARRELHEQNGEILVTLAVDAKTAAWLLAMPIGAALVIAATASQPAPEPAPSAPEQRVGCEAIDHSHVGASSPLNPADVALIERALSLCNSPPFQQWTRIDACLEGLPLNACDHALQHLLKLTGATTAVELTRPDAQQRLAAVEQRFGAWMQARQVSA